MYIVTAHGRFVAIDADNNLVQLDYASGHQPDLVDIQDTGADRLFEAGPLAGFRIIHKQTSIYFMRDENFLCAEPHNMKLVANRQVAGLWETFFLVGEYKAPRPEVLNNSTDDEVVRFGKKVAELIAENQPVKIHCACGRVPRPGFLNLDIAVNAPGFLVSNRDEYFIFPYANRPWGIPDCSVDYIFHEDFIEHITQIQQIQFLAEALRVLKPGCYHRVNTPNLIASMKIHSNFKEGLVGVYTGELQYGHIALFSPASLKEVAELVGYREVIFTAKNAGVSPYFDYDHRPGSDRDEKDGNIFADLRK